MKNKLSFIALAVSLVFMLCISFFFYPKWDQGQSEATIGWDVSGYYFYLPAFFIYNDYKELNWKDSILTKYEPTPELQQAFKHSSGNMVMKYPIGQSILMSPFFAIGHTIALNNSAYEADGFSRPYQYSIGIGMLLYLIFGLILFRRVMLHFFTDKISALLILGVVLGSNHLNYGAIEQAQSHNTLFFFYSLLLFITHCYYKSPSKAKGLLIGLTVGFMTIVRPTELLSILIPLFYGISNINNIRERFIHFSKEWSHLLSASLGLVLMLCIQLIYWKLASGDWVVYSYEDQGFSWLSPHMKDYCFSARSGWLRYCPFLILAFVGLPFVYQQKKSSWLIIAFILLFTYVVTSWDVWWFGGRAMIQSYPVLFISIGALFTYVLRKGFLIKTATLVFCLLSVYLNLWYTYQAHAGQISIYDTSDAYWRKTVGRFESPKEDFLLIDNKYQQGKNVTILDTIFSQELQSLKDSTLKKMNFVQLNKDGLREKCIRHAYNKNNKATHIRLEALVELVDKEWNIWNMPTMTIALNNNKNEELYAHGIRLGRVLDPNNKKWLWTDIPTNIDADSILFKMNNQNSNRPIKVYAMRGYYIQE